MKSLGKWAGSVVGLAALTLAFPRLVLFFQSGPLENQILFNSDALFPASLYRDLFEDRFSFRTWMLPPAPCFVPDVLIYFAARAIAGNFVSAMFLYALAQTVLFGCGLACVYSVILPQSARAAAISAAIGVTTIVLLAATVGPTAAWILPLFVPGHHGGAVIASLGAYSLLLRLTKTARRRTAWVLLGGVCVTSFLVAGSDRLFIALFTLPAVVTMMFFGGFSRIKRFLYVTALVLCAWCGDRFVAKLQSDGLFFLPGIDIIRTLRAGAGIESITLSVFRVMRELPAPLLALNLASVLLCALFALNAVRRRQSPDGDFRSSALACLVSTGWLGLLFAGSLLVGADAQGIGGYKRYFFATALFPIILGVPILMRLVPQTAIGLAPLVNALLLSICILTFDKLPDMSRESVRDLMSECLDANAQKYNLQQGLSDYWNAKRTTMFSTRGLRVNQLDSGLGPYLWVSNLAWYNGREREPEYSFLVTDRLDKKRIHGLWGDPAARLLCGESEVYVYNRPTDAQFRRYITRRTIDVWFMMIR